MQPVPTEGVDAHVALRQKIFRTHVVISQQFSSGQAAISDGSVPSDGMKIA